MNNSAVIDTKPLEELIDHLGVQSVFGTPQHEDGVTIIPVAEVTMGFGYGGGTDGGPDHGDDAQEGEAGGGGAGAGGRATPRGYIRIADGGVTYEAIKDEKWVALAGIAMVAWMIFWVTATVRVVAKQVAQTKQARR